LKQTKNNPN